MSFILIENTSGVGNALQKRNYAFRHILFGLMFEINAEQIHYYRNEYCANVAVILTEQIYLTEPFVNLVETFNAQLDYYRFFGRGKFFIQVGL